MLVNPKISSRKVGSLQNVLPSHYVNDSNGTCVANTSVCSSTTTTFANMVCNSRSNSHSHVAASFSALLSPLRRKSELRNEVYHIQHSTAQGKDEQQKMQQNQLHHQPPLPPPMATVASYGAQRTDNNRFETDGCVKTSEVNQLNFCRAPENSSSLLNQQPKHHLQNNSFFHANATTGAFNNNAFDDMNKADNLTSMASQLSLETAINNKERGCILISPPMLFSGQDNSPKLHNGTSHPKVNKEDRSCVVIPPPMLFIPIFMPPPMFLNSQYTSIFSLLPTQQKANQNYNYHKNKNNPSFGHNSSTTNYQKRVKYPRTSFNKNIKLRRQSIVYIPRNNVKVDLDQLQRSRRNFFCNWIEMMISFSTATLGRKLNTKDKNELKFYPSASIHRLVHGFDPIERNIEQDDNPAYRNIIPESMEHIRNTYAMQCKLGCSTSTTKLTRDAANFASSNVNNERMFSGVGCEGKDFLYLIVGLSNIFILQFIMVVLLFFCDKPS